MSFIYSLISKDTILTYKMLYEKKNFYIQLSKFETDSNEMYFKELLFFYIAYRKFIDILHQHGLRLWI